MSFSKSTDNGMLQFLVKNYIDLFKTVSANFMAIYLFILQLLRFRYNSVKPIAKM